MTGLPIQYGMGLAALLFIAGLTGLVVRRNTLFILMSLEIMLNPPAWRSSSPAPTGRRPTATRCSF